MPTLQDLAPYAVLFVVVAVVLGIGGTIIRTIQQSNIVATGNANWSCTAANETNCGNWAYNISGNGLTAIGTFGSWQNTLAIVVVAAVVIGVVATIFYNRR